MRHDERFDQYNVLSGDCTQFILVRALHEGERIDTTRPLNEQDLLPPLTRWQLFQDGATPALRLMAMQISAGAILGAIGGVIATYGFHPLRYICDHLPSRLTHASAHVPEPAPIPAQHMPLQSHAPSHRGMFVRHLAADDFPDVDAWEMSDRVSTQIYMEMQEQQRQQAVDEARCRENPEACENRVRSEVTAADYIALAAGGGIFVGAAAMLANGMLAMVPRAEARPAQTAVHRARQQASVEEAESDNEA